jgi:hypothetical protein
MKKLMIIGLTILFTIFTSTMFSQTYKSFIGEKHDYVIEKIKNTEDYPSRLKNFKYIKYDDGSYNVSISYSTRNVVYSFNSNDYCVKIIQVIYDIEVKPLLIEQFNKMFSRTKSYENKWYQVKEDFYVIYEVYDKNINGKTVIIFDTYVSTTKPNSEQIDRI